MTLYEPSEDGGIQVIENAPVSSGPRSFFHSGGAGLQSTAGGLPPLLSNATQRLVNLMAFDCLEGKPLNSSESIISLTIGSRLREQDAVSDLGLPSLPMSLRPTVPVLRALTVGAD